MTSFLFGFFIGALLGMGVILVVVSGRIRAMIDAALSEKV